MTRPTTIRPTVGRVLIKKRCPDIKRKMQMNVDVISVSLLNYIAAFKAEAMQCPIKSDNLNNYVIVDHLYVKCCILR